MFFVRITPKLDINLYKLWFFVLERCQQKPKKWSNLKIIKRDIKKALFLYLWEGKPLNFFINLMWGGIVIGCLPDPAFQTALGTMSISDMITANLFGDVCLLILPFAYIFYFITFQTPIVRLEIITSVMEIKLEE